jgi:ABC-type Zn uptake system ZnuABC Zn-binding protein ZnuA
MTKRRWTRVAAMGSFALLVVLLLRGCSGPADPWKASPGSPRVLAAFPPLYCFARNVAGDGVGVLCMHSQEGAHGQKDIPLNDILTVRKADVFLINGLGLETWVQPLVNNAGNTKLKVVAVGEDAVPDDKRLHLGEHEHGHDHAKGKEDHKHEGADDPHVWLGLPEAKAMVEKVCDELQRLDPARKEQYAANARAYLAKLDGLHAYGKEKLGNHKLKVITMHDSMQYFARCFGIDVVDTIQPAPGEDPALQAMPKLIKKATEQKVRVICHEPQYDPKLAQLLTEGLKRNGVAAVLVEFDPLETAPPAELDAGWYERRMRNNIDDLAKHVQ